MDQLAATAQAQSLSGQAEVTGWWLRHHDSDDDSDNDNDDDSVVLSGPDCPPTLTDADIETERRSEPRTAFTTQVDWTLSCP